MNNNESIKALLEDRFEFLYDEGFQILSFDDYKREFGDWQIVFQSSVCLLEIYSSRSEVDITFVPIDANTKKRIGLSTFVYLISNGERFFGNYEGDLLNQQNQIERLSKVLKEYLSEIMLIMNKGISKYDDALEKAGEAVFKKTYEEFRKNRYKPF